MSVIRSLRIGLALLAAVGCSSGGGASPDGAGGSGGGGSDGGPQSDLAVDQPGGQDAPPDTTGGFEPAPLPYFFGTCTSFGAASPVPTDRTLPYGLKVVATGLPKTIDLQVDATNAYLATSSALLRLPLAGGAPEMIAGGVAPVTIAIDADNIYWVDGATAGQMTILRAPLTATGATPTMLASQAGTPGPFTVGGGFVYFAVGTTIWRVPTGGGTVQTVSTTMEPRGLAATSDAVYFSEYTNETIQRVPLTGTLPAAPAFLKLAYAVPTAVALNGGDLYWDDWFGGMEYLVLATPTTGQRYGSDCSGSGFGGPCEYRLRPAGRGAIWASDPDGCGSIGHVNHDVSELMAGGLAAIGGIAGDGTHAYATTALGELLRFDP
jgi:hypothetical protein